MKDVRKSLEIYSLLIITLAVLSAIPINSSSDDRYTVYSYELNLDMQVNYVVVLTNDVVAVLGTLDGTSVIRIINVSETFRPETLFTYPISGSITSYAVDGFPARYIAVGTDVGEVVVFAVNNGRLYERLHYLQGADFSVDSMYLLQTPTTVKLAALSVNKKLPSEKYVYVFDVNTKGVIRLGPTVGNLSKALEDITPHILVPVKVVDSNGYFYDASRVLITYTGLTATLDIRAIYVYNYTEFPASWAYVEVTLYDVNTGSQVFSYSVNLNENGTKHAIAPLGYFVEVSIYDIYGNKYRRYVNLSDLRKPETITLEFSLLYRPDTRNATEVLPMGIKVSDFSKAPVEFEFILDLGLQGYIGTPLFAFKPTAFKDYTYMVMTEHSNYFNLTYLFKDLSIVDLTLYDYLGYNGIKLKFVDTTMDGKYILVALRDGRIKTYVYNELTKMHELEQEYIAPGEPINTELAYVGGKAYYVVYTGRGLQILSLQPMQIPLLRLNASLAYRFPGAMSADSSIDLSLVVIGGGNKLLIIKDLNRYIETYGNRPIDIDSVRLPSLTLQILMPNGTAVSGARTVITYQATSAEFVSDRDGKITLSNIFPGRYLVSIYPPTPHLQPAAITIDVPKTMRYTYTVVLNYTEYTLDINLSDEFGGGPQVPVEIYLNNILIVSNFMNETYSVKAPYGYYNITVRPVRGYSYFYNELAKSLLLDGNRRLDIKLERMTYAVALNVMDEVSREVIMDEVSLIIDDVEVFRAVRGTLIVTLKSGYHRVRVLIPPGLSNKYVDAEKYINVMTDATFNVEVPRRAYNVEVNLVDQLTGEPLPGAYDIYVNGVKLLSGVSKKFNITLPYGTYVITIQPLPPYNAVYQEKNITLVVDKDSINLVGADRVSYSIMVRIIDLISRVPMTPIKLSVNEFSIVLPAGTQTYTLYLPYGTYRIKISPDIGYENVYDEYVTTVDLTTATSVDAVLKRKVYTLTLNLYDVSAGPIQGLFDIFANETMVASGVRERTNITLPYDVYSITVRPQPPYMALYTEYRDVVKLFKDTSINVPLSRKYHTLTLIVNDDRDSPVFGATVTLIDTSTGSLVARGITDNNGRYSISTYYGSFQLIISYEGFYDYIKSIDLTTSITEKIKLQPQPLTLLIRNALLILIAVLIVISIVIIVKLRGKIAERIYRGEEFEF
ncbi:MAG: carboxypeptidase-like regulatory domain-containing protein [Sulfolobales archaeon]|nr:carboxypeptidase-like regulatory domain-containing protein [Sulfolobales archaeon]